MKVNISMVLQVAGVAIFAVTIWKGVHGVLPTVGLISGAGLAYVGDRFTAFFK
jgi:hypothetical protein